MSQTPKVHVPARPLGFTESARGVTSRLRDPLPPSVVSALPAADRKRHDKLAKAAQDLAAERRRLAEAVAQAPALDAQATEAAMLDGKPPPESSEPKLRAELEEATRLEAAAGSALRKSAVGLLNAAAPLLGELAERLEAQAVDDVEAIAGELEQLRAHVVALGNTFNEAAWIAGVRYGDGQVAPYFARPAALNRSVRALGVLAETFPAEVDERRERAQAAGVWHEHEADAAKREQRGRAEREAVERERREQEAEPSAEQAQGRVWQGREPV
jgi:hypothetical protein